MVCGAGAEKHFVVVRWVSVRWVSIRCATRPAAARPCALLPPPPADGRRGRPEMLLTVPNRCPTLHADRCGRLSPSGQAVPFCDSCAAPGQGQRIARNRMWAKAIYYTQLSDNL